MHRNMIRYLFSIAVLLSVCLCRLSVATASTYGFCGDDTTWQLNNGVLTISGTGEMDNYREEGQVPWYLQRETIQSAVIKEGVVSIGSRAFIGCTNLTSVSLPGSVIHIGKYAFSSCRSLESVYLSESVSVIEANPFIGCDSLARIEVSPASAHFIVKDGVLYSKADQSLLCYPCAFTASAFSVPEGTHSIGNSAFQWNAFLQSITLPDSVSVIGDKAFLLCHHLSSINLPDSVERIGTAAFSYCIRLKKVTLPRSLKEIPKYAFSNCHELSSVNFPDTLVFIGDAAFESTALRTADLPASLQHIGTNPFVSCGNLREIRVSPESACFAVRDGALYSIADQRLICLPCVLSERAFTVHQGTRIIGAEAFAGCDLTGIGLPDSVVSIESGAFAGCDGLTVIDLPASVSSIGTRAFAHCDGLTAFTIPDSVTDISAETFRGCYNLRHIQLPQSLVSIGDQAFAYCYGLQKIILPSSTAFLGDHVFYKCNGMTSVTLPDSLTYLGAKSFRECESLTTLSLPNALAYIGVAAFADCSDAFTCLVRSKTFAARYCEENGIHYIYIDAHELPAG